MADALLGLAGKKRAEALLGMNRDRALLAASSDPARLNAIRAQGGRALSAAPGGLATAVQHVGSDIGRAGFFDWFNRQPPIDPKQLGTDAAMGFMPMGIMGSIKAFHGSPQMLEHFQIPKNANEPAIFASNSESEAAQFGEHMHELDLNPKNMETVHYKEFDSDPIYDPTVMKRILASRDPSTDVLEIKGVQNFEHGPKSTSYAIFSPEIIKILRKYGIGGPEQ